MCKKKSGKGRARDHFAEASSVDTLLPPFLPLPHMLPKFVCRLLSLLLPMPYQPMLVLVCPMAPEPLEGDPVQTDRQIDGPFQGEWVHLMDELSQSISRTRSDISSSRSALCVYLGSQGGRGEGGGKVQRVAHRSCNGCWQERRPPPYEARANAGATTGPGRTTRAITEVPQMCPIVSQCHFGLCTMHIIGKGHHTG